MNWSKTILSLMIFYGLLALVLGSVGETLKTDAGMREAVIGDINVDDYADLNKLQSYFETVNESAKRMGIDQFKMGEYDLTDKINVYDVWFSNKSVGSMKVKLLNSGSLWDWIKNGFDPDYHPFGVSYDKWKNAARTSLHENESVYLYPHFIVDMPNDVNIWRYVLVRGWDANNNVWFTNMWSWEPWLGGTSNIVAELNGGVMGDRDLFYCLDFVVCDTDVADYFVLEKYLEMGKAELVERYGGMIPGDIQVVAPEYMQPHTISKTPDSGFSNFLDIIGNVGIAYNTFQGFGIISLLFNGIIFAPLAVLGTYIAYTEARSWVPFVSGSK